LTLAAAAYADEIRDYLIGRLGRERSTASVRASGRDDVQAPILDWWIFEGKQYRSLKGPLAQEWSTVRRQIQRLLASHNPTSRMVDIPEGEVDWLETARHFATTQRFEFKCRVTHVGLSDDELAALRGWQSWVARRWRRHVEALGPPPGAIEPGFEMGIEPSLARLRRWAHLARRSRWPLLRSVIAETLRCVFEPEEIDRLPLPTDPAKLFELLCLVRVLRFFEPEPRAIRWLQANMTDNELRVPGITCSYQPLMSRDDVLAGGAFDSPLRDAVAEFEINLPSRADVLIVFDEPRAGFKGILLEAKSGDQPVDAALWQLTCYRAALRRRGIGPLLVWAVAEQGVRVEKLGRSVEPGMDRWVFSTVETMTAILEQLFGSDILGRRQVA
jgi:hypothetical protein